MADTRHEEVSRGIITIGNRVLVCQGKGESFCHLPGGHIEAGEQPGAALVRELREELGRDVADVRYLGQLENRFDKGDTPIDELNHLFAAKLYPPLLDERLPEAKEGHLTFRWVPVQDLERERLMPPAVIPYVMQVAGGNGAV